MEHPSLELHAVPQTQILALVHDLLAGLDGDPRVSRNGLGRLQGALHELVVRLEGPSGESPFFGVGTGEGAACEDELHGLGLAQGVREALGAAPTRDGAEFDLGLAEVSGLGAVQNVAHHGELAAAAEGVARDGSDDGLLDARDQVRPRLDEGRRVRARKGEGGHLLDVSARRERLFGTRQHDGRDAV